MPEVIHPPTFRLSDKAEVINGKDFLLLPAMTKGSSNEHGQRRLSANPKDGRRLPKTGRLHAFLDEDSPWSKKNLLSLDGGGVRGLSSLFILKRLMEEIGRQEKEMDKHANSSFYSPLFDCPPATDSTTVSERGMPEAYLPCHYFDYIGGTSTGGLIAIMLGRLKMSVDNAIEIYKQLSQNVFEKPSTRFTRLLQHYDSESRRQYLKSRFDKLASDSEWPQFESDPERCRTIVCSIRAEKNNAFQSPFLFRSYESHVYTKKTLDSITYMERHSSPRRSFAISEVARATSAAPSFFKSVELENGRYYDGGVNLNNPSLELVKEVSYDERDVLDVLLSIGGGNASHSKPKSGSRGSALVRGRASYSESVDYEIRVLSKSQGFKYCRFNAEGVFRDVRLDEWKPKDTGRLTLRRIEVITKEYLEKPDVAEQCKHIAHLLVKRRMQRAETMQWESFATGARYKCPFPDCPRPKDMRFPHRNALMDHLRMEHDAAPPDAEHFKEIEKLLDRGRTNSGDSR